jgi:uncharacterized protein (TIGR02145 family)
MMTFYRRNKILFVFTFFIVLVVFLSNCKKTETKQEVKETGTVTDVQGNIYSTVKIGNQWWMAENLKVKRYNDSSAIQQIFLENPQEWVDNKTGAFCPVDARYGLHYNWYALSSNKLAPKGWHIPSDEEWKTLEKELGMEAEEANKSAWRGTSESEKLISKGSIGWPSGAFAAVYGTNESGFSAAPGGCFAFNGIKSDLARTAYFWTASQNDKSTAWYRNLTVEQNKIFRHFTYKNYGFSVRCVKD